MLDPDEAQEGNIVWTKGDICLSPWSQDGKLYAGRIIKLIHSPAGKIQALINFEDYEEEEEEVDVRNLRKLRPKKDANQKGPSTEEISSSDADQGIFRPLDGDEQHKRLREKYSSFEDEETKCHREKISANLFRENMSLGFQEAKDCREQSSLSRRVRKGVVAVGGEALTSTHRPRFAVAVDANTQNDMKEIVQGDEVPVASTSREPQEVSNEQKEANSGFNNDELEKPRFKFTPTAAKVPFLLSESGEKPVQVPATINQYLRDYQREGIRFLYNHYKYNRGALLEDDMGLGKTVQVIGFLAALLKKHGNRVDFMRQKPKFIRNLSDESKKVMAEDEEDVKKSFLIIGPGCVLYNWLDEFETWGYFSVRKYHGADKQECLADLKKGKAEIVVTTFETFRDNQESLNYVEWDAVIVDEVHRIKGLKAQTTQALRAINTRKRYGLTGTALQNNLTELWCLMDWAQPGCMGKAAEFEAEYATVIERGQRHDASKRDLAEARKMKEKLASIRKGMTIRRTKKLIADQLPQKDDNVVFCKLSQIQTSIYKTILSHPDMQLVFHMDDPCDCNSGLPQNKCCHKKTLTGESIKSLMFTFMHLLLKTANHVALLIPTAKTSDKQAMKSREICAMALQEHPSFVSQTKEAAFKTLSNPKYCGKMKVLQGLLEVFYKDHSKVLLFSYSTQVLDILEHYVMSTSYEYRRIDGSISSKKRVTIVREFNREPSIFICLISTKAGGLGLNLTGANRVVIFDPNWNPAHDLQAQDRAYRIGQRRNVHVFRLVSAGTIEENMYLRQIYKQQLLHVAIENENANRYFNAVQGDKEMKGELFGVKNMFRLRTGESCLTMDILKRNKLLESGLLKYDITKYIPHLMSRQNSNNSIEADDTEDSAAEHRESEETDDLLHQFFSSIGTDVDEEEDVFLNNNEDVEMPTESNKHDANCEVDGTVSRNRASGSKHGEELNYSSIKTGPSIGYKEQKKSQTRNRKEAKCGIDQSPFQVNMESMSSPSTEERKQETWVTGNSSRKKNPLTFMSKGKQPMLKVKKNRAYLTKRDSEDSIICDDKDNEEPKYDQTLHGSFTSIGAVFENCGVLHTHQNKMIVGGSRAEDHMTKCAMIDVYELHQNSQLPAVQCEPYSESSSSEEDDAVISHKRRKMDNNKARSTVIGHIKVLIGQTPAGIKRQQFQKLQKHCNKDSIQDLAQFVLSLSAEERVSLLNDFYATKNPDLTGILSKPGQKNASGSAKQTKENIKRKLESPAREKSKQSRKQTEAKNRIKSKAKGVIFEVESSDGGFSSEENLNVSSSKSFQDISAKGTPHRKKATLVVNKRAHKMSVKKGRRTSLDLSSFTDEHLNDADNQFQKNACFFEKDAAVNSRDLLSQIGKDSAQYNQLNIVEKEESDIFLTSFAANADTQIKNRTGTNSSFLDSIFSDKGRNNKKRKPPPSKNKKVTENSENCLLSESYSTKAVAMERNNFQEVDDIFCDSVDGDISGLCNTSTLKDDKVDCFQTSSESWKHHKRKPQEEMSAADKLILESETAYNRLFTSGKLRKVACNIIEKSPEEDMNPYKTPSLF
ncbi:hypothetical protein CHS0354_011070 [Potamilus streckersoni]|uniref:DNA excision repair protein ERCC-6-like 2 n=1 Tax=Potamilus streckersoni TaxID=2493646 RepID=A0AAE0TKW8_9BIVA|nr:hypothetical protein CHS0354_011070 [Potamilus streckersoni]